VTFIKQFWHFRAATLKVRAMLKTGESSDLNTPDGFPGRLRQVLDSYGSTSSLARAIDRSEGALRKWLRGQSEPNVSDLRAICEVSGTRVEWLVMGWGERRSAGDPGLGVGETPGPLGANAELPPLNYKLMDDVVRCIRRESPVLLGNEVQPEKQSTVLASVYNMSRRARTVDSEEVSRLVGLAA
jgi:transcriptional regulator with XRE-family HTH domain